MNEEPTKNGKQRDDRDEKGQFIKGNPGGPGNKGGNVSITTRIKQELQKCPEGEDKRTYLELLVRRILKKAIVEGDQIMIKSIWNYIDGMPKQALDLEGELVFKKELSNEEKELLSRAIGYGNRKITTEDNRESDI